MQWDTHITIHLLNIPSGEWNATGPGGTRNVQLQQRSVCYIPTASSNTDISNISQFLCKLFFCNFFLMMLRLHYSPILHLTFIFLLFFPLEFSNSVLFCFSYHNDACLYSCPFVCLQECCLNMLQFVMSTEHNTGFFARLAALEPCPVLNIQVLI